MAGVRFSGPTNSTFFTNCCGCAITDEESKCPRCKKYVYPYEKGDTNYSSHDARRLRWNQAFAPYRRSKRQ